METLSYSKYQGDRFSVFLGSILERLDAGQVVKLIMEPGDCTHYEFLLANDGEVCHLVYLSENKGWQITLGYCHLVPWWLRAELAIQNKYLNQHTLHLVCELFNRIYDDNYDMPRYFDFETATCILAEGEAIYDDYHR